MKTNLMKCFSAVAVSGLVSCTNLCQKVKDMGVVYSGVKPQETTVYYSCNGKKYIKGQRYDFRRTFVDHPYSVGTKEPDRFAAVEGSGGETVYREIRVSKDGWAHYADGSKWQPLSAEKLRAYPLNAEWAAEADNVSRYSARRTTWRALYAYPLSAVTFTCVDLPLNVVGVGAEIFISIPFSLALIASQ